MAPLEGIVHAGHGTEVGPALVHDGGSRHVTGRQRAERPWPGSEGELYSSISARQTHFLHRLKDLKTAPSTGEQLLKRRSRRKKFWTQRIAIH